jgi:hypothetical protein
MSNVQLRKQAKAVIDDLSTTQLRAASEFLAFVKSREMDSATLELLSIPGFEASFFRGMKDIKAGRTKPWRPVRCDVCTQTLPRSPEIFCRLRKASRPEIVAVLAGTESRPQSRQRR